MRLDGLVAAGHALLYHAEQIHAQLTAAQADLRSLAEDVDFRSLTVGVFGSLATRVLPQALAVLADSAPELHVETHEALSDGSLFAGTHDGQLAVSFAELPLQPGPFEWRELLVDPPVLLVPAGSALGGGGSPPTLPEIARYPIVVDTTWRMFSLIQAEFAAAGLDIDTRFSASSNAAVQAIVGAGLGVAIMPRLAVELADHSTEVIDLEEILPSRTLVCYWSRDRRRGPALEGFLDAVQTVCASLREQDAVAA